MTDLLPGSKFRRNDIPSRRSKGKTKIMCTLYTFPAENLTERIIDLLVVFFKITFFDTNFDYFSYDIDQSRNDHIYELVSSICCKNFLLKTCSPRKKCGQKERVNIWNSLQFAFYAATLIESRLSRPCTLADVSSSASGVTGRFGTIHDIYRAPLIGGPQVA